MTTRDRHGDYCVKCDACGKHQSTAQPTEYAARSSALRHGWALRDNVAGRDLCPMCAHEARMG